MTDGEWYFINTDATSLEDNSPHDAWIAHGMAFTGGTLAYGTLLSRLSVGDTLLMWANGQGVVAVGRVTAPWDGVAHQTRLIYVLPSKEEAEYRIAVDWHLDLRDDPLRRQDIGWNPVQALQRVTARRADIEAAIAARVAARPRPPVVFVDADALEADVRHIRVLRAQGAALYAWSSGGTDAARRAVEAVRMTSGFAGFVPRPDAIVGDVPIVQLPPGEATRVGALKR